MNVPGCVALVTGRSRGLGAATALELARAGAAIGINYQSDFASANEMRRRIETLGGRAVLLQANVAHADQVQRMVAELLTRFGRIDVLVNNAGMPGPGTIDQLSEDHWRQAFAVHVDGSFHCVRAVLPGMQRNRRGVIVNVASVAALRGGRNSVAYQTVKAAIIGLTRALARDLADVGIRVNCVSPGLVDTDFHRETPMEQRQLARDQRIPLHRDGQAEEVADAIMFLIRNDYITGENIVIDGGLTMRIA